MIGLVLNHASPASPADTTITRQREAAKREALAAWAPTRRHCDGHEGEGAPDVEKAGAVMARAHEPARVVETHRSPAGRSPQAGPPRNGCRQRAVRPCSSHGQRAVSRATLLPGGTGRRCASTTSAVEADGQRLSRRGEGAGASEDGAGGLRHVIHSWGARRWPGAELAQRDQALVRLDAPARRESGGNHGT